MFEFYWQLLLIGYLIKVLACYRKVVAVFDILEPPGFLGFLYHDDGVSVKTKIEMILSFLFINRYLL